MEHPVRFIKCLYAYVFDSNMPLEHQYTTKNCFKVEISVTMYYAPMCMYCVTVKKITDLDML